MLIVKSASTNEAWRKTFVTLFDSTVETDNKKYYRDEPTLIEITNPQLEDPDPLFPMSLKDLETINRYIHTGESENKVIHEWTKIYYHRMFDEPNSQIEYLIKKLQENEPKGEAQISMWDKDIDQTAKISPCTQIIWARIKFGKLELHIHAHSSDAYKKLLMNIQEFVNLQHYIADRLSVSVGNYYHFIDSCHIHWKDIVEVEKLISEINEFVLK